MHQVKVITSWVQCHFLDSHKAETLTLHKQIWPWFHRHPLQTNHPDTRKETREKKREEEWLWGTGQKPSDATAVKSLKSSKWVHLTCKPFLWSFHLAGMVFLWEPAKLQSPAMINTQIINTDVCYNLLVNSTNTGRLKRYSSNLRLHFHKVRLKYPEFHCLVWLEQWDHTTEIMQFISMFSLDPSCLVNNLVLLQNLSP